MKVYEIDGHWYAEANGGYVNNDQITGGQLGPFPSRPEPVARWQQIVPDEQGHDHHYYTTFKVGETLAFTLHDCAWVPGHGNAWQESWEILERAKEPPVLGEAYRWAGSGWEPIPHPLAVAG